MELTQNEINERVAVLKRYRSLLEQQRSKFAEYLKVLELQENEICEEDENALRLHTEIESQIVENIACLQKVIVPMQSLYEKSHAFFSPQDSMPVSSIQNELESLQKKVQAQNSKNQALLKVHMEKLQMQMANFTNPFRNRRSPYAKAAATSGSMFAIEV